MINYNVIFLFVFIFSTLIILRTVFKFISSLLQNPPQKMVISSKELLLIGLSTSYFLTYILSN
jgi:hypothetical protein